MLEYLELFKCLRTDQIQSLCYPDNKIDYIRQRLKKLYDRGDINRNQTARHIDQQYIYYTGRYPPKQSEHRLKLIDVYITFSKTEKAEIEHFETEYSVGNLRADGYFEIGLHDYIHLFFVEIHQFGMFNFAKYELLYRNGDYKKYNQFPSVIIVTDMKLTIPASSVNFIHLTSDMQDFNKKIYTKCTR